LPKAIFDYLDGGAEGEVTLRENCRVFEDCRAHTSSAGVRFDCSVGSFVRQRSCKLVSPLNTLRTAQLQLQTGV
jgi:hypothetical protein